MRLAALGRGGVYRGCPLELGPLDGEARFVEPGDVVALHADELGPLETPVV